VLALIDRFKEQKGLHNKFVVMMLLEMKKVLTEVSKRLAVARR
jgi:hypothetical protein